ncbi:hypothetical protein [Bradyrhizobium sp. RDM4]|uniref:hypothetical protein n=1 Tax=Bradyrhizobium sp. RDM4 TaxID=3378765 RepID=UPI0038FC8A5D
MSDLLELVIEAHGGMSRWKRVRSISATVSISGALMTLKGFPEVLKDVTVSIDTGTPRTVVQPYGGIGRRGIFVPDRVWIEDAVVVEDRAAPRSSFAGHVRDTPWDDLHRLYFLGYALWNYLTTPFLFARPGFVVEEGPEHEQDGGVWRVLKVTYPADIPAHCAQQLLYFDSAGMLKRLDYVTDIAGGVASHYCYDPKTFDGLVFPTLRRVVRRTESGPHISSGTAVLLNCTSIRVGDHG